MLPLITRALGEIGDGLRKLRYARLVVLASLHGEALPSLMRKVVAHALD
jgi:hypothetical protein